MNRVKLFHQWKPILKQKQRTLKLYNSIPTNVSKIYFKVYTERKGKIQLLKKEYALNQSTKYIDLTVE